MRSQFIFTIALLVCIHAVHCQPRQPSSKLIKRHEDPYQLPYNVHIHPAFNRKNTLIVEQQQHSSQNGKRNGKFTATAIDLMAFKPLKTWTHDVVDGKRQLGGRFEEPKKEAEA